MSAVIGTAACSVRYSNLSGVLNADANLGDGWLNVLSNISRPPAPGAPATVTLKAICPTNAGTPNTDQVTTTNNSRISCETVGVSLTCTATAPWA